MLDLAALKTPPGEYLLAFHGSAVAKYRHHPEAVPAAEAAQKQAEQELQARDAEVKQRMDELQAAAEETRDAAQKAVDEAVARQKAAQAALTAARERVKTATQTAQPRDIVDIVVTEPITLRVQPAETP
uniref:Uncharacterized protein n=1 Tax=Schlesneria paludicola TaxID=360056 RepID=A0A7C2NUU3_9PLAN